MINLKKGRVRKSAPVCVAGEPIMLEEAKNLALGTILYDRYFYGLDQKPVRWRVNGRPQTWKTRPEDVRVPLKHGLYTYGEATTDNLHMFSLEEVHRC